MDRHMELTIRAYKGDIEKLIKTKQAYETDLTFMNALEWRFEFPEILDDEGKFIGFDVIIGNPPYGVSIKDTLRQRMVKRFGNVPDYEIYYFFIELSRKILKYDGINSFIIPNTFLFNVNAQKYRLQMLNDWVLKLIVDCTNFKIFNSATVCCAITFLLKTKSNNINRVGYKNTLDAKSFTELSKRETLFLSNNSFIENNINWGLIFKLSPEKLSLISKIRCGNLQLINLFPDISQGLIAYDKYRGQEENIIKNRVYHHSSYKNGLKKWLWGEDVKPFVLDWNGKEWIDYCKGVANPREPKFFIGKRILIREITNPKIYATFTENEYYHDPAIIVILDTKKNHISILVLLAIMNSKLATFYHFNSSPKATKGAFPKILVKDIQDFPLPVTVAKDTEQKIIDLVQRRMNTSENSLEIESQIDSLVYALYGLTDDEIRVIEGDL
jgi:hypothetical protein